MESFERIIRQAYFGIRFPVSFFRFQSFADDLLTNHGVDVSSCALQIQLGDVFQVFEPDFDRVTFDPAATSRYPNDPPEFLTVIHGPSGGLHWGYYVEDPGEPEYMVASYFHEEPLRFSLDGANLLEALRKILEKSYEDNQDYLEIYGEDEYKEELEELDLIRGVLKNYDTQDRAEVGKEYLEKYGFTRIVTAQTRDGIGIALPGAKYRPIPDADRFIDPYFTPTPRQVDRYRIEALALLEEGFPGATLKLGKDLWCYDEYREESYKLLAIAYEALGREPLLKLLKLAQEQA